MHDPSAAELTDRQVILLAGDILCEEAMLSALTAEEITRA